MQQLLRICKLTNVLRSGGRRGSCSCTTSAASASCRWLQLLPEKISQEARGSSHVITGPVCCHASCFREFAFPRLLGKHLCLADAFRCLDLNVNQEIGPQARQQPEWTAQRAVWGCCYGSWQEWGVMFRGSGLATFREASTAVDALSRPSPSFRRRIRESMFWDLHLQRREVFRQARISFELLDLNRDGRCVARWS